MYTAPHFTIPARSFVSRVGQIPADTLTVARRLARRHPEAAAMPHKALMAVALDILYLRVAPMDYPKRRTVHPEGVVLDSSYNASGPWGAT